jgi:hypothetical protein
MTNMKRSTRAAGAMIVTAAAAALLTGCTGVSASPVGGNLNTPFTPNAAPDTSGAGSGSGADPTGAAAACIPQTANIAQDTAAEIMQTVAAEIPKGCGFTLTGTLESPAEQNDGAQLQGNASYDGSGNTHFSLLDQGMVLDTYVSGGSTYLRLYEADAPKAVPDADVKSFWQPAFSASSVATVGSAQWVQLTTAQLTELHLVPGPNGLEGFGTLSSVTALAADLANGDGETWTLDGSKTVNGIPCVLLTHAANGSTTPKTAIAVDKATGQLIQVSYSQASSVVLATFSNWGTTPAVTVPTAVIDGSTLS